MKIDVLDTRNGTDRILAAPLDRRPDLLRELLAPVAGMYRYFPGEPDLVALHHMGCGFRVDRDDERVAQGLDLLVQADAWTRVEDAVRGGVEHQLTATPGIATPDELHVVLVLGDPGNADFLDVFLGASGNGSVTGYVWVCLWPSPENLARLEAMVVHELNHNLRYCTVPWNPMTVPVGEQIVSEGLADAFARELYGDLGYARIGVDALADDAAFAKVVANLGVTGMRNFTAWVHGDPAARLFGVEPVGVPRGAGYAAGNRLVDAYLAATGQRASEALLVDRDELVRVATSSLGV